MGVLTSDAKHCASCGKGTCKLERQCCKHCGAFKWIVVGAPDPRHALVEPDVIARVEKKQAAKEREARKGTIMFLSVLFFFLSF